MKRWKEMKRLNTPFYLAIPGAFPVGCDFLECATVKEAYCCSRLIADLRASGKEQERDMWKSCSMEPPLDRCLCLPMQSPSAVLGMERWLIHQHRRDRLLAACPGTFTGQTCRQCVPAWSQGHIANPVPDHLSSVCMRMGTTR